MRIRDDERVRYLEFDRPEAKNPFSGDTADGIIEGIETCDPDEFDAIIITGEGDTFSAGGDLDSVSDEGETARNSYERYTEGSDFVDAILSAPVPTIAKVNGDAFGVAISIVALCDFAIAAADATFAAAFVKIGLIPDGGGTVILPRLIGFRNAMDILLTGRPVSATEADDMDLVTETVPADDLDAAVQERVDQCRNLPTVAMTTTRQALHENAADHWSSAVDYENLLQAQLADTEEHYREIEAMKNR
jgi:2-(1,2-epoxy-1,2-dihydrophenyl)acetyl-CoA isomerase